MIDLSADPRDLNALAAYDYPLPEGLIAQQPIAERDRARLLCLTRPTGRLEHRSVADLPDLLAPGDLLVLNNSRVLPARLRGRKPSGGAVELLLVRRVEATTWQALTRPGLRPGQAFAIAGDLQGEVELVRDDGLRVVRFDGAGESVDAAIHRLGELPTPPYVRERLADPERYQTTFAAIEGSVAAPTAGLHFTPALFDALSRRGVGRAFVTLHVGPGTFQPVKAPDVRDHRLHAEWAELPASTAAAIAATKRRGGRVVAVGTTVVRTLETAARELEPLAAWSGETSLFVRPGFAFRVVDGLLTNFHLPRSTLLMLVAALAGYESTMAAYAEAVHERYRFFSFGDAMLIL